MRATSAQGDKASPQHSAAQRSEDHHGTLLESKTAARQQHSTQHAAEQKQPSVPMKTTRLYRFSPGCHGLPSPSLLLPNWSIMCTPWNTNLQQLRGCLHA